MIGSETARRTVAIAVAVVGAASGVAAVTPNATAEPTSSITGSWAVDERTVQVRVHSASMDTDIMVDVLRAADRSKPAPTLYLLNGGGGGMDSATWQQNTDVTDFLADKQANVVQPIGGRWSYYTDWRAPDPKLGVYKWKTFLTEELPPLIDAEFGTTGVNAIAGLSTSGTSVLQLPIAKPGLYRAVAAYSGCAQTSDPIGQQFVKLAVESWGGGDTENMYGPPGDPMWAANDPYVNAEGLRGLKLFISTGTRVPGMYDTYNGEYAQPGPRGFANQLALGGLIEAAVNWCTHNLQGRLQQLGIPATFDFQPTGTHSWGYWQEAMKNSWPVLAEGLGLPR
ncbi:esterase family protein [Nocardia cyriacigeorgica]|uniref:Esterase family protein n=1 Tax=Nocardia cyriacigeorgica TaxID=135487 RepID=A0A6P1DBE4_9NOCA|nr:alpha/beta hydrolase family protein [Nocardia cyriacigeorgica]NEW37898.1 esterase family protein [Nocardia cyriacigeorgica]NEW46891.1 esterase family protein [Nocardia cyriacigeorgica]NEW48718.1 esterase family protein [Nocardia cyriacigeorgica]NEW56367.1 esterase family protein [Nocardia cyriacigeorgica]